MPEIPRIPEDLIVSLLLCMSYYSPSYCPHSYCPLCLLFATSIVFTLTIGSTGLLALIVRLLLL